MLRRLLDRLTGRDTVIGSPATDAHSQEIRDRWNRDGYVSAEGLFSADACDAILDEVRRYTGPARRTHGSMVTVDILHGEHVGRLMRIGDAPETIFSGPFKINNLFADSPVVASAVFARPLRRLLTTLLGSEPVAINSLNFTFGSQQPDHIDSWYMPPPKANSMAVASISLEDTDPDAGPVVYYPGSHLIDPYVFSHGGINAIDSEMPACRSYIEAEVARRGLRRQTVLARKGDVFIWHCQLLHGGSPIAVPGKTRPSLVVHYWGSDSLPVERIRIGHDQARMLDRDYLWTDGVGVTPAPGDAITADRIG